MRLGAPSRARPLSGADLLERGRGRALVLRQPPWALAGVIAVPLALAYLILAPPSGDMAAASYRSYLFAHSGLTLWDNAWYGGHHLLAYSLLSPALGSLLGPRLVQVIAAPSSAVLFALLIRRRFPPGTERLTAGWFALGISVELLSGRVPFDLGLALSLGALLAARHRRLWLALPLAVLASVSSPVAGMFLLLACLAWAIGAPPARPGRLALRRAYASTASRFIESRGREAAPLGRPARLSIGLLALIVIVALAVAFPEGGSEPFAGPSFWPAEALLVLIGTLIDREQRVLRVGILLYGAGLLAAFLIPSPLGGNAVRLGALAAGPLAAGALWRRRRRWLIALAPALTYWQLVAPLRDFAAAASDPSVESSYYTPLLDELSRLSALGPRHPTRIEVVPTRNHWEARWMAPHVALARGWERQLDRAYNPLFYDSHDLTSTRYEAWLEDAGVSYVALPDAPLDSSGRAEERLLRGGVGYLSEVWRSAHWRLFAVLGARGLAQSPAVMISMSGDAFTVALPEPGRYLVRVRYTPYWAPESGVGCVRRAPDGLTELSSSQAGEITVGIDFSLARIFQHGPRCRAEHG